MLRTALETVRAEVDEHERALRAALGNADKASASTASAPCTPAGAQSSKAGDSPARSTPGAVPPWPCAPKPDAAAIAAWDEAQRRLTAHQRQAEVELRRITEEHRAEALQMEAALLEMEATHGDVVDSLRSVELENAQAELELWGLRERAAEKGGNHDLEAFAHECNVQAEVRLMAVRGAAAEEAPSQAEAAARGLAMLAKGPQAGLGLDASSLLGRACHLVCELQRTRRWNTQLRHCCAQASDLRELRLCEAETLSESAEMAALLQGRHELLSSALCHGQPSEDERLAQLCEEVSNEERVVQFLREEQHLADIKLDKRACDADRDLRTGIERARRAYMDTLLVLDSALDTEVDLNDELHGFVEECASWSIVEDEESQAQMELARRVEAFSAEDEALQEEFSHQAQQVDKISERFHTLHQERDELQGALKAEHAAQCASEKTLQLLCQQASSEAAEMVCCAAEGDASLGLLREERAAVADAEAVRALGRHELYSSQQLRLQADHARDECSSELANMRGELCAVRESCAAWREQLTDEEATRAGLVQQVERRLCQRAELEALREAERPEPLEETLMRSRAAHEAATQQVEDLEHELERAMVACVELRARTGGVEPRKEEDGVSSVQRQVSAGRLSCLGAENLRLSTKTTLLVAELRESEGAASSAVGQAAAMRCQVQRVRQELMELQSTTEELEGQAASVAAREKRLTQEVAEEQERIRGTVNTIASVHVEEAALQQETQQRIVERAEKDRSLADIQGQARWVQEECRQMEGQLEALQVEFTAVQGDLSVRRASEEALASEVDEVRAEQDSEANLEVVSRRKGEEESRARMRRELEAMELAQKVARAAQRSEEELRGARSEAVRTLQRERQEHAEVLAQLGGVMETNCIFRTRIQAVAAEHKAQVSDLIGRQTQMQSLWHDEQAERTELLGQLDTIETHLCQARGEHRDICAHLLVERTARVDLEQAMQRDAEALRVLSADDAHREKSIKAQLSSLRRECGMLRRGLEIDDGAGGGSDEDDGLSVQLPLARSLQALRDIREQQRRELEDLRDEGEARNAQQLEELERLTKEKDAVQDQLRAEQGRVSREKDHINALLEDGQQERRALEHGLKKEIQRLQTATAGSNVAIDETVLAQMSAVMRETNGFLCHQQARLEEVLRERDELHRRLLDAHQRLAEAGGPCRELPICNRDKLDLGAQRIAVAAMRARCEEQLTWLSSMVQPQLDGIDLRSQMPRGHLHSRTPPTIDEEPPGLQSP